MKKILALDPGTKTGWAVIEGRTKDPPYFELLGWGQVVGWAAYEAMLRAHVPKVDIVVVEVFHARPEFLMRLAKSRKWVRLEEPEKIGYAKGYAKALGKTYYEQQPADIATGNKLLPGTKTDKSDKLNHQKDALAQAAVYNHRILGNQMERTVKIND